MKTWQKIAYAAGSLGTALSYQAFNTRITFFYLDDVGISPAVLGAVWLIYALWNSINDPLLGQLSDNTRTRWGRRIPYIAFGAIPLALVFVSMWIPPRQAAPALIIAYFFVTVFAFDTLFTLVVIAWTALFPEMFSDLNDRAAVSGWRQVFSLIGVIGALAAIPIVIDQIGYPGMGIVFGAITGLSMLVSLLGSRENPALHVREETMPMWQALKAALANLSFRWFAIANLAKEFTFLIIVGAIPFYAKYAIRLRDIPGSLDASLQESLLLGVPFILAIPAMFVWARITQRIGSRKAWIYASLAFIPGLVIVLFAWDFLSAIAGTILLVLGLPGLLMLSDLLVADVIDEDELAIGHRREGLYFGMNGAIIRLAYALQAILIATLPTWTGYSPNLDVQPEAAVWGFRFLMAGAPLIALFVTVAALRRYPLHGERLEAMRTRLGVLHNQMEMEVVHGEPEPA